jgi:hypothetical protein
MPGRREYVKDLRTKRRRKSEAGVVLLIAIFVLMLVSVVAIALILSAGTESALTSNYRSSAAVYYAAVGGLEEARGRLQPKNPDFFNNTVPGFMPTGGAALALGQVRYIVNGGAVNPANAADPFPDTEYASEFGAAPAAGNTLTIPSISGNNAAGIPGPLYKWVRINAVTETSLNLQVSSTNPNDSTTPLYYDSAHVDSHGTSRPSLIVPVGTPPATAVQAIEITSLAVLPNGSRKLVQYVVAPMTLGFTPVAALTMIGSSGNIVNFIGPGTGDFYIDGRDHFAVNTCVPGPNPVTGIGYTGGTDASGITAAPAPNYPGIGASATVPSVGAVPLPWATPSILESKIQDIAAEGADAVLTPSPPPPPGTFHTYTPNDILSKVPDMSDSKPKTVYVNGNLDLTGWHNSGYGFLIVTGTVFYDPDANWFGEVFVVGQGKFVSTKHGLGQFQGAMLIAQTRDINLNILTNFGPASFSQTGTTSSGYGVYYSSCWINYVQPQLSYKVLSFREIPQ